MSAVMEAHEPSAKYLSALQPPLVQHFELMVAAPGGVAKLRELILTLGVQGKLVPQDPKDEPASELLKRIRADKDRLIAQGKTKRGKPLAELEDQDEPFVLPDRWCWVRLGEITNYGSPVKAGTLLPDTWVLDMEDIEKSSGRLVQRLRFAERPAVSDKNCFSKGDVLYGKLRPYLNKVLVADEDGVCTTEIIPFRCYGEYEPGYFRLALSSPFFLDYVNARSYGMKMPRLGTDDARNSVFPLPPLAEQSRIVTRVEELMRLCDALEAKSQLEAAQHAQLVQTLLGALTASATQDELADNWQRVATHFDRLLDHPEAINAIEQTILQLAVRGLLVPQDPKDEPAIELLQRIRIKKERPFAKSNSKRGESFSEIKEAEKPFDLPRGWEWVRMGDLIEGGSGTTPLRARTDYFAAGTEMWVKTTDLNNGLVTSCEELITKTAVVENRLKYFPAGTVCVAMYGGAGTIGKSGVLGVSSTINQSVFALPPAEGIDTDFLHTYVVSVRAKWMSFAAGLRKDPNINGQIIKRMVMPLPPLAEQRRIVARVESLRRLCADLRQRLAARQTTQALLAEALIAEVA